MLRVTQEKHKQELDALKSAHVSSLTNQAADCEVLRLRMDSDRINIEQLKKALDVYQQKEVRSIKKHLQPIVYYFPKCTITF